MLSLSLSLSLVLSLFVVSLLLRVVGGIVSNQYRFSFASSRFESFRSVFFLFFFPFSFFSSSPVFYFFIPSLNGSILNDIQTFLHTYVIYQCGDGGCGGQQKKNFLREAACQLSTNKQTQTKHKKLKKTIFLSFFFTKLTLPAFGLVHGRYQHHH